MNKKTHLLKSFKDDIVKNKTLFFMILPAVVYFLIFCYLPMAGAVVAFKSYNYIDGIFGSPWVGLKNFKFLIQGNKIYRIAFNTVAYNTVFIIVNQSLQLMFSVFLAELGSRYFKKIAQSVMILPHFISWVVVGGIIYNMLNYEFGAVNTFLKSIGMPPFNFHTNVGIWKYIIVFTNAWKGVGYGTVIYLAAIMGIDQELYESADIDGATKLQKTLHITIPCIVPQIVILILMRIGNIFRGDFEMFYQVTGNNPLLYNATDVIDTFDVRSLLHINDIGMSSAAGLAQSVVSFFVLIAANSLVRRYQENYALF